MLITNKIISKIVSKINNTTMKDTYKTKQNMCPYCTFKVRENINH